MAVIHVRSDEQSLDNKSLLRLSPADFAVGVFSHVGMDFRGKKSHSEREWGLFKSLPGILCMGKPVLCASRMGVHGLKSLLAFVAALPTGEVLVSPHSAEDDRSVAVFCLSQESLPAFDSLLWDTLLGIDVALAIAPTSTEHIEELLRNLPRPLFRRQVVWMDFWLGCSRSCELTVIPEDGCQIEVSSSKVTPQELEASIRAVAERLGIDLVDS